MKETYTFFIQAKDGAVLRWTNLTLRQVQVMNSTTDKNVDWTNVNAFGWEKA